MLARDVATQAIRWAPKTLFTGAVGVGARLTVPRAARRPLYTAFARAVGASIGEVELPLEDYPSFGAFFSRRLKAGARSISDTDTEVLCSPCDGAVACSGEVTDGRLFQAKGRDYSLEALLADPGLTREFAGGSYMTIYLSPRDYHRVHSPLDGEVQGYTYVPGTLYPVNPIVVDRVDGIFARNERIVIRMTTAAGPMAVVLVGATGVGNIVLSYPGVSLEGRDLRRNGVLRRLDHDPVAVSKGDELGAFALGSTVIMVLPKGASFEPLQVGDPVQFGQVLGTAPSEGSERG